MCCIASLALPELCSIMYFLESKNLAGFGAVLHVLVEGHMRIRVAAQLPQQAIAPVSHSTDSYGKRYRKLRNFYAQKFREHVTHVVADTPKGGRPHDAHARFRRKVPRTQLEIPCTTRSHFDAWCRRWRMMLARS